MVVVLADDGVDPVCKLRHGGKGIWEEAGAAAPSDEGVDPVDQPVADQGPAGVPLCGAGEIRRLGFQDPPPASLRGWEVLLAPGSQSWLPWPRQEWGGSGEGGCRYSQSRCRRDGAAPVCTRLWGGRGMSPRSR